MARAQSPFSIQMRWTRHSFLARRKSASRPGENILSAIFGDTRRTGGAGKSTERLPLMPQTCIAFAPLPKRHDGELQWFVQASPHEPSAAPSLPSQYPLPGSGASQDKWESNDEAE